MSKTTTMSATLSKLGEFARAFADPENLTATISKKALADAGVTETVEGLRSSAREVYLAVSHLAHLREAQGVDVDKSALMIAESTARKACNGWFKAFGSRPGRKVTESSRPLYSCTAADFVIIGENCALAREASATENGTDWKKVEDWFLDYLMLSTGRLIAGKPLERLSSADFKAARRSFNQAKAKKAQATKAENATKAEEQAQTIEDQTARIAELEAQVEAIDQTATIIAQAIEAIKASHATDAEKAAIIAMLSGETAHKAEKTAA